MLNRIERVLKWTSSRSLVSFEIIPLKRTFINAVVGSMADTSVCALN